MLQQPFWKEIEAFSQELESLALAQMKDAKHADPLVLKGLHQRWLITNEVVTKILSYPRAVIEGASESAVDYGPNSDENSQQGDSTWQ